MILQIVGNVPGLQNAGAMWAEEFTGFLLDFGFTQSITDRRLFHLADEGGRLLIVGTFVDDCKVVIQSESKAAEFTKAWEERYRDPPDVEATARDFLGLKYTRVGSTITISCNKATDDLAEKLEGIATRAGAGAQCASPLPDKALSLLEMGAGPGNKLLPEAALPRARSILGLAGWIVCHARPDAMLAFVAIARRVSPGRLTEYAWDRLVQWGSYLVKTRDVHLTMRKVPAGTEAACYSDSSALNGPVPGSSYGGACLQYSTGDPTLPDTVMSGAIWARCLVPPKLGDSSAAAELIMATVATKEVMAYRMQAEELGHGLRRPTPLYLDANAVLHGTATEQVSREMKYLAAKLAIVQQARNHGKIRTFKIDENIHPADILTKPLQGREFVYKRARILGLEGAAPPPRKGKPAGPAGPGEAPPGPRADAGGAGHVRQPVVQVGGGTAARFEQLARGAAPGAPGRGVKGDARPATHERGTWGHALARAGFGA